MTSRQSSGEKWLNVNVVLSSSVDNHERRVKEIGWGLLLVAYSAMQLQLLLDSILFYSILLYFYRFFFIGRN